MPGYHDTVQQTWGQDVGVFNPFLRLHIKLSRTAKALRQWAKKTLGNNKLLFYAARQLIAILDIVQEHRQLSSTEILLRRDLKARYLGLAAVEKLRARQQSRLISIRASEANSKLFYLQANGRRRKKIIRHFHEPGGIMHTHEEKSTCVPALFRQARHATKQGGVSRLGSHPVT